MHLQRITCEQNPVLKKLVQLSLLPALKRGKIAACISVDDSLMDFPAHVTDDVSRLA